MPAQPESTAEWVARWRWLGPVLERERTRQFAADNPAQTLASFDGLLRLSLQTNPPSPDSGLIEQQRLFRQLRDA